MVRAGVLGRPLSGVGRRGDGGRARSPAKVKLPAAVAVLVTEPASRSAWVTV